MDLAKSLIVCLFTAFCPDPSRHYFGRNLGNYLVSRIEDGTLRLVQGYAATLRFLGKLGIP